MREHVEKELQIIRDTYLVDIKRVTQDYHGEIDYQESYHGRELLELLQNADDEMKGEKNPKVQIRFDGTTLTISNNGNPFSTDGVRSLMLSNISPKRSNKEFIGNMGTGFRSILGWAKKIQIHSADLHIQFTHSHSQQELNKIYPNSKELGLVSATLVFPEWIEKKPEMKYTTEISIKTSGDKKVREEIIGQINKLNGEILLFLNHTQELELICEDTKRSIIKKAVGNDIVIEEYKNSKLIDKKEWLIKSVKDKKYGKKYYSVTLAYDKSGNPPTNQVVYAYFPTKVQFPFNVLLHADFAVNLDRNGLKVNDENREIFKTAAGMLVDLAADIFKDTVSYAPLQFLLEPQIPAVLSDDFHFDEHLHTAINQAKLFPTQKGYYSFFNDQLRFYYGHISEYVTGEIFDNLMPYCSSKEVSSYIVDLFNKREYSRFYEDDELTEGVNLWVESLPKNEESIEIVVKCLMAMKDDPGCSMTRYWDNALRLELNVLFDEEYNIIPFGEPAFNRLPDSEPFEAPRFMNIRYIHPYMEEYILNGGDFDDLYDCFDIRAMGFWETVDAANEEILRRNEVDLCYEELEWVWRYQDLLGRCETSIVLPNRSGELMLTENMYFGSEYKNDVEERIISFVDPDAFVIDIKERLSISNSEAKKFLTRLGVKSFPAIRDSGLNCYYWTDEKELFHSFPRKEYRDALLNELKYPFSKEGFTFKSYKNLDDSFYTLTVSFSDILNLETILKNLSTTDILYWINHDDSLRSILINKYEKSVNTIDLRWLSEYRRPLGAKKVNISVLSPIYWLFTRIPWIEVNGNKYCIGDCLLDLDDNVDLSPCLVKPAIDDYISEWSGKHKKNRADCISLFRSLGVQEHFSDLSVEKIYETLAYLPETENSGVVAKRFYRELLDDDSRKRVLDYLKTNEVSQYKSFLTNGKVYCHNGKYISVKKACYITRKGICSTLLDTLDLIAVSGRIAYSALPSLFGVKELLIKGLKLYNYTLNVNNSLFIDDFKKFKTLAFVYRVDSKKDANQQAKKFINLNVLLCSQITIEYNDSLYNLSDGDFYYEAPNTFYLCNSTPFKTENKDIKLCIGISSIICSHLDIADNKSEFQCLYSASTTPDRMTILSDSFDDDTINRAKEFMRVDDDAYETFIQILDKLSEKDITKYQKLIDDIDFENFYSKSNYINIIKLFRHLDIDIEEFNASSGYQVYLIPFYQEKTESLLSKYKAYFKTTQYQNYLNSSIEDKMNLQSEFIRYETVQDAIIYRNSVYYDCEKEIIKQLSINTKLEPIDFNSLFNDNKSILKDKLSDPTLLDDFLSYPDKASLLYYGEYDLLVKLYDEYVASLLPEPEPAETPAPSKMKSVTFVHVKTRPHVAKPDPETPKKEKTITTTGFKNNSASNTKYGRDGERYVYYELLKDEKKKNVVWKSENGQKEGVYPEGSNKYGYDLEYIDENEDKCYIEVKASTSPLSSGVSFHLSSAEYSFGQKHAERYFVYYVSDVKTDPKIYIIDNLFKDGEFNLDSYSKQPESYLISADVDDSE